MKKFLQVFAAIIILVTSLNFASAAENLSVGAGVYELAEPTGLNQNPIKVYYYRPKNWQDGDKVFVVFHGMDRQPEIFIDGLKKQADEKNLLLICPEFTKEKYPGDKCYNFGNVMSNIKKKILTPKTQWTFTAVNRIIDDAKKRAGANKSKIIFYGHSAGGQFMHRYLFFADNIKADLIIAANAGMYIMPDENVKFPYGFKNVPIGTSEMKRAFAENVIILLGEKDVKRGKNFPKSTAADKQGLTRFERGKNFYAKSKAKAAELNTKFNWRLVTVPNVGHAGVSMAKIALKNI